MTGILKVPAAFFHSLTMVKSIIPVPPTATNSKRNGARQRTVTPRTKSGDIVLIRCVW